MAKTAATPSQVRPLTTNTIIPKFTDPRARMFFMLGALRHYGVDFADDLTQLVIDATAPAADTPAEAN